MHRGIRASCFMAAWCASMLCKPAVAAEPSEGGVLPPPSKVRYHVVSLGDQARASYAINKLGIVAGQEGTLPALLNQGLSQTLTTTPGVAAGVNDSNAAAGSFYPQGGPAHPFYWKKDKLIDIGPLPGGSSAGSFGVKVNKSGAVLCVTQDESYNPITYVWKKGKLTEVVAPSGLQHPRGTAMDDLGDVAGYAETNSGIDDAFVILGGIGHDLGGPGIALAMNNVGAVVGHLSVGGTTHAVLWSAGTTVVFDPPAGGAGAEALGINDKGQIVGDYFTPTNDQRGFISHGDTLVDLNTLLDSESSGWEIQTAGGINESGMITGMGLFGGQQLSFVAHPVKSK